MATARRHTFTPYRARTLRKNKPWLRRPRRRAARRAYRVTTSTVTGCARPKQLSGTGKYAN
eukprot:876619-Lingulodinium_polyedra.AAC.1